MNSSNVNSLAHQYSKYEIILVKMSLKDPLIFDLNLDRRAICRPVCNNMTY